MRSAKAVVGYTASILARTISAEGGRSSLLRESANRLCVCHYGSDARPAGKPQLSEKQLTRRFVDWRKVYVAAGNGGDGCISLRHEAHKEFGGPDGGDGGNGGHVIVEANRRIKSLETVDLKYRAQHGDPGRKNNSTGRNGSHTVIKVPMGTVIKEGKTIIADLVSEGDKFILARGGQGGRGNRSFVTPLNRTPRIAGRGTQGQELRVSMELRTMAFAGLIGFPNAGKSTLLRALSRARPAVAAYPFTTLNPHVGMVEYDDLEQIAVADLPGLIHGAHLNRGLGHSFLRHIERCSCLLFVLDLSSTSSSSSSSSSTEPWDQLEDLRYELEQYQEGLSRRPQALVANKLDLPGTEDTLRQLQERTDLPVIGVSAKHLINVGRLKAHLREMYDRTARDQAEGDRGDRPGG